MYQRFSELFPKIKKVKNNQTNEGLERKGQFYLKGIAITPKVVEKQIKENTEAIGEAAPTVSGEAETIAMTHGEAMKKERRSNGEAESLAMTHGEAKRVNSPILAEILKVSQQLSEQEKQQLASMLFPNKEFGSFDQEKDNKIISQDLGEVAKTGSIASPLDTEGVIASPTASPTASPNKSIASPSDTEGVTAIPADTPIASPLDIESDTAFSTASPNGSIKSNTSSLDIEEVTDLATDSSNGSPDESTASPSYTEDVTAFPPDATDSLTQFDELTASPNELIASPLDTEQVTTSPNDSLDAEKEPSYVRYKGKVYTVVTYENGLVSLRISGFKKIVHRNVSLTDCDEVFYD